MPIPDVFVRRNVKSALEFIKNSMKIQAPNTARCRPCHIRVTVRSQLIRLGCRNRYYIASERSTMNPTDELRLLSVEPLRGAQAYGKHNVGNLGKNVQRNFIYPNGLL